MKSNFPCCLTHKWHKTLQNKFKYLTSLNKNLKKKTINIFGQFFRLIVQEIKKDKDFLNFCILLQTSIMDCSFFLQITHINLSVVKVCHSFS